MNSPWFVYRELERDIDQPVFIYLVSLSSPPWEYNQHIIKPIGPSSPSEDQRIGFSLACVPVLCDDFLMYNTGAS